MPFQNQVVVITGGGRGIGRAIALKFAEEGANVVIAARSDSELESVAEEIRSRGTEVLPIATDVTEPASVATLFERTVDRFGHLDVLVNNAGVWIPGDSEVFAVADWDTTMDVNARGAFLCSQQAYEPMSEQDNSSIINISSIRGKEGYPNMAAYSASKFAMNGLTEALSREWLDDGIRVNSVCPGPVDTGYATGEPRNEARILPEDVAELTVFLASPNAEHITGEAVVVSKQDYAYERYDE